MTKQELERALPLDNHNMLNARNLYSFLHNNDQSISYEEWASQYILSPGHIASIHYIQNQDDYMITLDLANDITRHHLNPLYNIAHLYLLHKSAEIYGELKQKLESINRAHRKEISK